MINRILLQTWSKLAFQTRYFNVQAPATQSEKLLQFTDALTKQQLKDTKQQVSQGRSWKVEELRLKSTEDLTKLWYVMLKEKNLLLSDGIFFKKVVGVKGRMGKLVQLKISMARLKTVVQERDRIRQKYRKQLEDEYVKQKTEQYLAQQQEISKSEIEVPEITPNLLRAKVRDLKLGKDDVSYIEQALRIKHKKEDYKQYLREKYDYKNKPIVRLGESLPEGKTEDQVIRQFKSSVQEQIETAKPIPQDEILRSHVKNWFMLGPKQKRVIVNFLQARRARESKSLFLRELDLLGQKIRHDLQQYQQQKQAQQQ
ncbi:unnamed protein product (macronuclear) [Paramecium tetraurelia]|uniref:Large ribosomal subunit protein uL29m n=1 Tax=Paramecium tetraurelia TaxID=5888 RepID=A0CYR6_PARTE|nr:uncharacterized protein GSPATT00011534001 [Paramecium tetraurelia]CAK75933.1 unnamed protein product [Paramecium tetraurelia]|eukprot:XP_001443330.1 hypothetical protein (macronuclear) [Paramecium tetraurelia strain d4-2]